MNPVNYTSSDKETLKTYAEICAKFINLVVIPMSNIYGVHKCYFNNLNSRLYIHVNSFGETLTYDIEIDMTSKK